MEKIVNCTKPKIGNCTKCPLSCTLKEQIRYKCDTTGELHTPKRIASRFDIEIANIRD